MSKGWKILIVALLIGAVVGVLGIKDTGESAPTDDAGVVAERSAEAGIDEPPAPATQPETSQHEATDASDSQPPATPGDTDKATSEMDPVQSNHSEQSPETGAGRPQSSAPATEPPSDTPDKPKEAKPEKEKQRPRFVEVGAESCVPCKMMQPVLEKLRRDYAGELEIKFADVHKNPDLGEKYGVRTIPTQVIYDSSGKEVFRHTGYWPKDDIDAKLQELGIID